MPGAERSIEIDASPAVVFGVITDYEKYPNFLADVSSARVLNRDGHVVEVEQTLALIKSVTFSIRVTEKKDQGLSWTLISSRWMKSNVGGWTLEALPGGRTKATYRLEVGVGRLVPGRFVDKLAGTTLPATLEAFKARAESLV